MDNGVRFTSVFERLLLIGNQEMPKRPSADDEMPANPGAETLQVEMEPDFLDAIDAYAATQRDKPSRPEAVRRILREWLGAQGLMRARGPSGGTRPEDLNSANDD